MPSDSDLLHHPKSLNLRLPGPAGEDCSAGILHDEHADAVHARHLACREHPQPGVRVLCCASMSKFTLADGNIFRS